MRNLSGSHAKLAVMGADGREIWVERCKYPDLPHYGARGTLLGEDEHGTWVGLPGGHPVYRGDDVLFIGETSLVTCVARDDWFMVHFWTGHEIEIYVDIVTPPVWTDRGATMVDLDFDVIVRNGEVSLIDEDEFEEHRVLYKYPSDIVAGARRAAQDVLSRVQRGDPPFTMDAVAHWQDCFTQLLGSR